MTACIDRGKRGPLRSEDLVSLDLVPKSVLSVSCLVHPPKQAWV